MNRDKLAYLIGNLIIILAVAIGFPLVLESCSTCHGPCGLAEGQFEWFKECVMTRFGLLLLASVAIAITLDNELRAKAKDFLSDFLHVMSFYLSALSILALAMGPFLVGVLRWWQVRGRGVLDIAVCHDTACIYNCLEIRER